MIVASFSGSVSGAYLTDGLGRLAALILFSVRSVGSYTFFSLGDV